MVKLAFNSYKNSQICNHSKEGRLFLLISFTILRMIANVWSRQRKTVLTPQTKLYNELGKTKLFSSGP